MPEPEVIQVMQRFRERLLRLDASAAADMVNAYGPIFADLSKDIDLLLAQVSDEGLTFAQTKRLQRFRSLQSQIQREVSEYASTAAGRITEAQRASVGLAQSATRGIVDAGLPPGIDTELLARVGIQWNALPTSAFETFVGFAGDGSPLANLLDPLGVEVRVGVTDAIGEGIARGKGPRETARLVRNRFGMGLTRSLRISRTETLRSYREATRAQYQANSNIVKGFRRVSAKDGDVCMACIALDGTFYESAVSLDEHVNGRCAMEPVTLTYKDLGLDVPQPPDTRELGQDWFRNQPESVQQTMMGKNQFTAWKEGKFDLGDMAKVTENSTWGAQATVKPLKELVG